MLVDSHCHLNFPDFKQDLPEVLKRAAESNIKYMQTICTRISEFPEILAIAKSQKNIFCSVGIHPHEADNEKIAVEKLIELSSDEKVIGIGETGLDYFYENSSRGEQQKSFLIHIEAARKTGIPIIIHTRDADEDTAQILKSEMAKGSFSGLLHCFTSSWELAKTAMDLGFYISISGIVTFKKAVDLQETVKKIPFDRLLVETDSPFLAPNPHRGKRNEPAFTKHTAEFIAGLRGISAEELAEITTNNFFQLFKKAKR